MPSNTYNQHTSHRHRAKLLSIVLYDQSFSRYKVVKTRKCTRHHTDLEHLTVKSTLYEYKNAQTPKFYDVLLYYIYSPLSR